MRGLFQSFDHEKVEYLLIGGQATVIYRAADFTQAVDIWVRLNADNFGRLLRALASCRARVHRLVPLHWMSFRSRRLYARSRKNRHDCGFSGFARLIDSSSSSNVTDPKISCLSLE